MAERFDVVVIGAGLGGLAAAGIVAGQGRRVMVLERNPMPGGYAQCFQRGPYRFDASLHALNGVAPGGRAHTLYQWLGFKGRIRLHRLDPLYRLRLPDLEITAHADRFRYESELISHFPAEADGIRAYLDETTAIYHDSRRVEEDQTESRAADRREFTRRYPALSQAADTTWEQLMARHVSDPRLQGVLGALWGYVGLPPSRCAAAVGAGLTGSFHEYGGWYPEGGAQALSNALAQVITDRGGVIRYGQPATGIEFDGDRVAAVTSGGEDVEAEFVISNASAPSTMLSLVGRDRLPADYVSRVEARTSSYTTCSVYLGLRRDVGARQRLPHELLVASSYDPDEAWRAAQRGDWERTALSITDYTHVDPNCAPPGHATLVLNAVAPWDYRGTWGTGGNLAGYHDNPRYQQLKDEVADALVARADAAVPGLADAIEYREASTPLTNFDYTHNPRGAIEGYENSPANSGSGRLPQTTPIRNLFLAGAWTTTGGMNSAMESGVKAARLALQGLLTAAR